MQDNARIQATIDTMTAAFGANDVDRILSTYETEAVVVGQAAPPAVGKTALRELFQRFAAIKPKFKFLDHEIIQAGDIALHLMPWTMQGQAPDGSTIQQGGLSVAVLRKQSDGRWLMVIDHPYGDHLMQR